MSLDALVEDCNLDCSDASSGPKRTVVASECFKCSLLFINTLTGVIKALKIRYCVTPQDVYGLR